MSDNTLNFNRRDFFKSGILVAGGMLLAGKVHASAPAKNIKLSDSPVVDGWRTLGSGKAALKVSNQGFGCMGLNYHRSDHPDKAMAIRLLHQAVDHGINFFDTAEGYGPFTNEELVGESLAPYKNRICIATKFGHAYKNGKRDMSHEDSRPENIRKVCDDCLRRLKIDTIGLFYQHRFDINTPIEDVAGTVGDLIKEGKVQYFGLCEISAETLLRAHKEYPVTAVQSEYSLMWRQPEQNLLPLLKRQGIGFVPYSPLGRGFLTGGITEYTQFSANDNRQTLPRFTPEAIRYNLQLVEKLNDFGRTRGMTPAQIALAWLMAQNEQIVPIPGTTKLSHMEENLRAAEFKLSHTDIEELNRISSDFKLMGDRYGTDQAALVGK
ncbi:MAG: aldo/keto reductase [Alphaproteobacteria bacterium]